MNLLLIQRKDCDLYNTLLSSETSRNILKFYRPQKTQAGVLVRGTSLGSTLSLVSELRWYVRRYVECVLFEIADDLYCTHLLAQEIYEREVRLQPECQYRMLLGFGTECSRRRIEAGNNPDDYQDFKREHDSVLIVCCSKNEWDELKDQANIVP